MIDHSLIDTALCKGNQEVERGEGGGCLCITKEHLMSSKLMLTIMWLNAKITASLLSWEFASEIFQKQLAVFVDS